MTQLYFQAGKKKREELQLPILHFVVADNWIDTLGMDAFRAWLKFLTWVDRTENAQSEYGNKNTIPRSLEDVWEALNMKKTKFYQKVIYPLWDHGLIDIVDWENSRKIGQKPKNIIVYEYPQNDRNLAVKPLEKCRDYKTDYSSSSAIFGRQGGRPKVEEEVIKSNRSQTQTVTKINVFTKKRMKLNRSQMQTVDGSQTQTVTVRKQKPINVSNTLFNVSNTSFNDSNLSIKEEISNLKVCSNTEKVLLQNIDRLIDDSIPLIEIELAFNHYQDSVRDFADILNRVLTKTKTKIGNIRNVIDKVVVNDNQPKEKPSKVPANRFVSNSSESTNEIIGSDLNKTKELKERLKNLQVRKPS